MKKQEWFCENCNKEGLVEYNEHADLFSVLNKITANHESISPDCETGRTLIRCVNHEKDI